ncbi:PaaX family transcriptional regulator C-terminal domain-containing protein [Streptomyces sp. V2]|uniref:PaaX family transcriptional regulator C-terminal domain-containing protein n=1 Tax=Streptomyces sp. V2 TaxID=1424099 RepID=UPI0010583346|nr:PaaX family transcriptional regulator C-terminal domain-containing protein [Streptomyces sp. V2]
MPAKIPRRPPLSIVMTTFGLRTDLGFPGPLPAALFVQAGLALGINEPAMRAALRRSVERGLLQDRRVGRSVEYDLSPSGSALVRQAGARMFDPAALGHSTGEWTLLAFPTPPALRNDRYQLGTRLEWAGFGRLMSNLWITPGRVDASAILDYADPAEGQPAAFEAVAITPTDVASLIERVWDMAALRQAHDIFLGRWEAVEPSVDDQLPQLVELFDTWGDLLRADPGLPAEHLPPDWPATRSAREFHRLRDALWNGARDELTRLLPRPAQR